MSDNKTKPHAPQPVMPTNTANSVIENVASGGNVDQIRDILFGSQMKDYDRKFSRLEERILKEVSRLKEDSNKRLDSLESFINREIESLSDKLNSEKINRDDSLKELASELNNTAKALEKKLSMMENSTDKEVRNLRQSIMDQSKRLLNEISHKHDEGMSIFDRSVTELRDEKVTRSALSGLLTEVAIRLADNSHCTTNND